MHLHWLGTAAAPSRFGQGHHHGRAIDASGCDAQLLLHSAAATALAGQFVTLHALCWGQGGLV
eukprot:1150606-Pelagomonas_calceolata.AAC.3